MRNGQLRRCFEMGLELEVLAQLQQPSALSLLLNTPVSWCNVTIDGEMVKKILTSAQRSDEEVRLVERALRLGATTHMLQQFFGISPQDVAPVTLDDGTHRPQKTLARIQRRYRRQPLVPVDAFDERASGRRR
ncbi:STY4526/YPO1902 family pathogenicity island replication protein [Pseudomonas sp. Pseu.R1]|uniref:STY4526/YPO1902 family pathogenicity island replication protein n=1 Tax=Pseudomonas sp. Pseu.R1 TaxID=3379818 RepID=UPI003B94C934